MSEYPKLSERIRKYGSEEIRISTLDSWAEETESLETQLAEAQAEKARLNEMVLADGVQIKGLEDELSEAIRERDEQRTKFAQAEFDIEHLSDKLAAYNDQNLAVALECNSRVAKAERERDEARAKLEPWVDGEGITWTVPTAWAYAQACKVVNGRQLTAESQRDALAKALRKLWKHTPQIDNGWCAVCRHARRVWDAPGKPGRCEDERCLSHVVIQALAMLKRPAPADGGKAC